MLVMQGQGRHRAVRGTMNEGGSVTERPLLGKVMNFKIARVATALASLGVVLSLTSSSLACGGLFCNGTQPVNQAAERIIFAQDENGTVTQIVEIMYEGEADDFSWVLPVPGTPTPGVSSVQVFDRLQQATNPVYRLNTTFDGRCSVAGSDGSLSGGDGDGDGDSGEGPTVTVVDSGAVGPFNYETISIDAADEDPADVAVSWLLDNGYDPGPMGREVLGPYLQNGLNLIGFKLQEGRSADSIRPVSLTYEANAMAIPIQPTAVAVNDDMPILVWVLGADRAVPTNYRGLELNELLINWFNPSSNYNDVVIAAADEAGGQGFVTEFAGDASAFVETISPSWEAQQLDYYSDSDDVQLVLSEISQFFANYDGFLDVVTDTVNLRANVTPAEFVSCPYCYFYPWQVDDELGFGGAGSEPVGGQLDPSDPIFTTDLSAFLAAVDEEVLTPIAETAALFEDHEYLTRFYTTMSADEMDKDPIFQFNPDLEDVSNVHVAEQVIQCRDNSWKITLPDGTNVYGKDSVWPYSLEDTDLPLNVRVVQYGTSGPPQVITDNRSSILSTHLGTSAGTNPTRYKKKGLCSYEEPSDPTIPPWTWLATIGLGGVWLARRRNKHVPVSLRRE